MDKTEKNNVDKLKITKGLQKIAFGILFMFIGPVVLNSTFKNEGNVLFYPVLIIGIIICGSAMFLFFKGIKTLVKGIFND